MFHLFTEQIVSALKEAGIPHTYVLYPNEGHGFAQPENRLSFAALTEEFLHKCLDLRTPEPMSQEIWNMTSAVIEQWDGED